MNIQENKSRLSKPKQKRGLTLISSLILIVLVAIALIPLLRALSISLFVSGEIESNIIALNLAQGKLEEIRSLPYENISSEAKSQVPKYPRFQREVIVTTPQTNLKDIEVVVYWDLSGGAQQNVSFETYAANF
jgi:Tfp pilus assembly protein PilV